MKIERRDALKRKLAAIPKAARAEIRKELAKQSADVVSTARRFAPQKSGALKKSIDYTFGEFKPDNANVRGVGGGGVGDPDLTVHIHAGDAKAYYAAFVEFGTAPHVQKDHPRFRNGHPGAAAHPFFFPAWRLGKKKAKAGVSRATRRAVKKALGK